MICDKKGVKNRSKSIMDKKGNVGHIEKDKKNKAKAKPHYSIISIISLQVVNNQRHQRKLCGNCFNQICADKQNMKNLTEFMAV